MTIGCEPKTVSASFDQPAHDPSLPVEVVHREHAAGLELGLDVAKGLLGEQEALEADARIARMQGQRIDERVTDQVVACGGLADEAAAVVEVNRDPRVAVGPVGMMQPTQLVDHRVDLDGVDMAGAVAPAPPRRRCPSRRR